MTFCTISFSVNIASDEGFLKTSNYPVLTVMSSGHALHVYINGVLAGNFLAVSFGVYCSLAVLLLTFQSYPSLQGLFSAH